MSVGYPSDCSERFGACTIYAHGHCAECNAILNACGSAASGPVDGYMDPDGKDARECVDCTDSLLCSNCGPICPFCVEKRLEAAAG